MRIHLLTEFNWLKMWFCGGLIWTLWSVLGFYRHRKFLYLFTNYQISNQTLYHEIRFICSVFPERKIHQNACKTGRINCNISCYTTIRMSGRSIFIWLAFVSQQQSGLTTRVPVTVRSHFANCQFRITRRNSSILRPGKEEIQYLYEKDCKHLVPDSVTFHFIPRLFNDTASAVELRNAGNCVSWTCM